MSPDRNMPLGARVTNTGAVFSLWAPEASRVELCIVDARARERRFDLERRSSENWVAEIEGLFPGQRYGYRVHGPHDPSRGRIFQPDSLLADPRALAYEVGDRPLSLLADPHFDWQHDPRPKTSWCESVIYELHVRGMTKLHPLVPPEQRGTYRGLAHPAVIEHLKSLGITAIELMPVFQFLSEPELQAQGKTNYWGYNPIGFFAPHHAYASAPGNQIREFQEMVRSMHRAGIEVLLDVVFNHTAEGGRGGPLLCWKGLANRFTYRLDPARSDRYLDWSGCGNTLHFGMRSVLDLVRDSLRYWVEDMHVDGFRFDLATTLGRTERGFHPDAPFFQFLRRDDLLSSVKLIAEPWDLGPVGYRLGAFPEGWREWNDRYRNGVRSFWRGDQGVVPELASRLAGSSDIFGHRGPTASINYVTAHDGFTLTDLVTYRNKNNLANGEDNRDGSNQNLSRNWGAEGPSSDPAISETRNRVRRSLFASLLLSQGVPMISHGDELGRTQGGNNNAYCQDDETTWIDWEIPADKHIFLDFCKSVLNLRRKLPAFRREIHFGGEGEVAWLDDAGLPLDQDGWNRTELATLGLLVREEHRSWLLLAHAGDRALLYPLPDETRWFRLLDTARPTSRRRAVGQRIRVLSHSLVLLEAEGTPGGSNQSAL